MGTRVRSRSQPGSCHHLIAQSSPTLMPGYCLDHPQPPLGACSALASASPLVSTAALPHRHRREAQPLSMLRPSSAGSTSSTSSLSWVLTLTPRTPRYSAALRSANSLILAAFSSPLHNPRIAIPRHSLAPLRTSALRRPRSRRQQPAALTFTNRRWCTGDDPAQLRGVRVQRVHVQEPAARSQVPRGEGRRRDRCDDGARSTAALMLRTQHRISYSPRPSPTHPFAPMRSVSLLLSMSACG
jgi:hypothetical protein